MKAKDMIKKLSEFDPEEDVLIYSGKDGWNYEYEEYGMDVVNTVSEETSGNGKKYILIYYI